MNQWRDQSSGGFRAKEGSEQRNVWSKGVFGVVEGFGIEMGIGVIEGLEVVKDWE